jgi:hypothetical protein
MSEHIFNVKCHKNQSIIIELPEGYATVSCFRGEHAVTLTNYRSETHGFKVSSGQDFRDRINASIEVVKRKDGGG